MDSLNLTGRYWRRRSLSLDAARNRGAGRRAGGPAGRREQPASGEMSRLSARALHKFDGEAQGEEMGAGVRVNPLPIKVSFSRLASKHERH